MTVETRWASLLVTDYLSHDVGAGRTDLVRVISGQAKAVVSFAPRPEFAQAPVHLRAEEGGLRVFATNEPMVLRAPGVRMGDRRGRHPRDRARGGRPVTGRRGSRIALRYRGSVRDLQATRTRVAIGPRATGGTGRRRWTLPELNPSLMKRSALTLRGLVHADTGAIMAAATTSLPEDIGGVRNWDYRYCWIRDAAMTAASLVSLGSTEEAEGYLNWLHGSSRRCTDPSGCIRCTPSPARCWDPRRSSTPCPVTPARGRCGSATPRMPKSSWMFSARSCS